MTCIMTPTHLKILKTFNHMKIHQITIIKNATFDVEFKRRIPLHAYAINYLAQNINVNKLNLLSSYIIRREIFCRFR